MGAMRYRVGLATVVSGAVALCGAVAPGAAQADPDGLHTAPAQPGTGSAEDPGPVERPEAVRAPRAAIVGVQPVHERLMRVFVDSPAMHRTVQVMVLLPADRSKPRPTIYMLDGRSTQIDSNNWLDRGGAAQFYADKPVNVVFTVGGPASFYTDWQRPDPVLGINKWETFLTEELPPLLDAEFAGNGRNAVVGTSMGAEGAMMLAIRKPELYSAVGAHSGCFSTGTDLGQAQARMVVTTFKGNPENMFGAPDDPAWLAHDVTLHAEALRGKKLYLSAGSGRPGVHDVLTNPETPVSVLMGGPLEAATDFCTRRLAQRLDTLDIDYTAHFRPQGTHSWPYWADELVTSWPTISEGLGIA